MVKKYGSHFEHLMNKKTEKEAILSNIGMEGGRKCLCAKRNL